MLVDGVSPCWRLLLLASRNRGECLWSLQPRGNYTTGPHYILLTAQEAALAMDIDTGAGSLLRGLPCSLDLHQLRCTSRGQAYPEVGSWSQGNFRSMY